jgi:casein kinase 1
MRVSTHCEVLVYKLFNLEQSRRDDLEAIGYVLVYLFKGSLPWQGLKVLKGEDRYKKIYEYKLKTTPERLCCGMPSNDPS